MLWRDMDTNARLMTVCAAGLLAGAGAAWLMSGAGPSRAGFSNVPFSVPIVVLAGWSLIGSGLLAWRSRPDSHLGTVLIFTGFAWFASVLPAAHNPVLFTAGEVAGLFCYVGLAYLVLSFRPAVLRAGLTAGWWQRRSCHDGLLAVEIAGNGVGGRGPRDRVGPARACRPGGGAQRPANRVQPPGEGNNVARGVPMRVVVADDAVILREGLAWLLSR